MIKLSEKIVIDANIIAGIKLGFGLGVILTSVIGFVMVFGMLLIR